MRAVTSESEWELQYQSVDGGSGELSTTQPHLGDTISEFRDRVSSFATELNSTAATIEACSNKLQLEEEKVEELRKELERKKDELEKAHQAAKRKSTEFEAREKGFEVMMKKEIAVRSKLEELVEELKEDIESEKAEKASVEDRLEKVGGREEELQCLGGYLEVKSIQVREDEEAVEKKRKEVEAKEKEIDARFEEFRSKEKKFEEQLAEFRKKQAEFEVGVVEFNAIESEISEKDKQCREPETNARPWSYELIEEKFEEKFNMLSKRMDEWEQKQMKYSESIEKQVEMRSGETFLKEAERPVESLDHSPDPNISLGGTTQAKRPVKSLDHSPQQNTRLGVITSGKDLQIFLNEHSNDYDSVKDEVERTIKLSSDPAKLVLEAMEGFYPPHLKKGDVEFEEAVVRKNCILLLEWVTKMSPYVEPATDKEALDLAIEWRGQMKSDTKHSLEVIAFLQLLAAFHLADKFKGQIVGLLRIITRCSQAPLLLRDLVYADRFVRRLERQLLKKKHQDRVAKRISAFQLDWEFPNIILPRNSRMESNPAPLLQNNGTVPIISAPVSSNTMFSALDSPILSSRCTGAKRSWSDACRDGNDTECSKLPQQKKMSNLPDQQPERSSSDQAGCSNRISINTKDSGKDKDIESKDSDEENGNVSLPRVLVCVPQCLEGSGKSITGLHKNIENNKLRCVGISDMLRLSPNPAEFVLSVVKDPSSLNLKLGLRLVCLEFPEHGPLLLLNYLRRMSPHVKPGVRQEALSFAKDWKSELAKEKKSDIEGVSFLLFLAAFRLEWYFDQDELFSVLGREHWCIPATKLLVFLGMKNSVPIRQFLGYLVKNNQPDEALKCLESAKVFESDLSARSTLSNYLLKLPSESSSGIQRQIRDIKRELAVWEDVNRHDLADEACRSHISDLNRNRQLLQARYSRTLAR